MPQRLIFCLACSILVFLVACQGYDYTLNDKVVYRATPLLTDFTAPDIALHTCLEQAIADGHITAHEQLTSLSCGSAGIVNLEGLANFINLKALRLSSNQVRNLVELSTLGSLEQLYLSDNQIIDPVPLYPLTALRHVDLANNNALQCPKPGNFAQVATVILPLHCR